MSITNRNNAENSIMARLCRAEQDARSATPPGEFFELKARRKGAPLAIDGFFGSRRKLLNREMKDDPISRPDWLRQAVDAAFKAAMTAHRARDGAWAIGQWEGGSTAAEDVVSALDRLLGWMTPSRPSDNQAHTVEEIMRPIWLAYADKGARADEQVASVALSLVEARAAAAKMAVQFRNYAQQMTTQNVGEIEKRAFVLSLAESWHFFCGRIHTVGNTDATPFRAFVGAAWQDIGGADLDPNAKESFFWAIRAAQTEMKKRKMHRRPYWFAWNEEGWWTDLRHLP